MGTTTPYGWRYPEPTAPVRDGANDMKNLANDIATTLNKRIGDKQIQSGSNVVTLNGTGDATITLPTPFAAAPTSFLGQVSDPVPTGGFYMIAPFNQYMSASAIPFRVYATNGGNPGAGPLRINWIAIGVST